MGIKAHHASVDFERVTIPAGKSMTGTAAPQIPDDGEGPLRRNRHQPTVRRLH